MNDYAIIENGIVVNVIVGPLPNGMDGVAVGNRQVSIGDRYENGEFISQTPAVELTIDERIALLMEQLAALEAMR